MKSSLSLLQYCNTRAACGGSFVRSASLDRARRRLTLYRRCSFGKERVGKPPALFCVVLRACFLCGKVQLATPCCGSREPPKPSPRWVWRPKAIKRARPSFSSLRPPLRAALPPPALVGTMSTKHRIADLFPVGSPVSPQVVREYVGDAVSAQTLSRLTDKILSRPPVKFIFNTVLDILKTTGYDKDLMERLESRGIAAKNDRTAVVQMMSDAMTAAANYSSPLIIPAKICAGKQVDRTRLLLAVFGHVALGNEGKHTGRDSPSVKPAVRAHSVFQRRWARLHRRVLRGAHVLVLFSATRWSSVLVGRKRMHALRVACPLRLLATDG